MPNDQNRGPWLEVPEEKPEQQLCEVCEEPTGRTDENSLYIDDLDEGPLCADCFKAMSMPDPVGFKISLTPMERDINTKGNGENAHSQGT